MTPVELLRLIAEELAKEHCKFAVCGGIAASIYRADFRTTNDLDIAICLPRKTGANEERDFAVKFLDRLGYETAFGWVAGIATSDQSNIFFVIGRPKGFVPEVDLLLPNLPWVRQAVERAQDNKIDFGFAELPTITPEDLLISKAFALKYDPNRPFDLDDIKSVLKEGLVEDMDYVKANFRNLQLDLQLLDT